MQYFLAILVRITDRYKRVGEENLRNAGSSSNTWIKFSVNIMMIYKRSRDSRIARGNWSLYINSIDLACRCPKIKPNK